MCLAIPGQIMSVHQEADPRMAKVSFGGVLKEVCLDLVPEAVPGDYVVVHVGFALSRLDEQEALETIRMLKEMGEED
jgi:hydrogenase expression/formation protein HypC